MKGNSNSLRYPALPQTNALEESVREAEKQAYKIRLLKDHFFDLELSKCETIDEVLQLSNLRESAIKIHENGIKLHESKKWGNFKFYDDADTYSGIPITVSAFEIITSREIPIQRLVEPVQESLQELSDQVQDVLTNTSGIIHVLKDASGPDLTKIDPANTEFLYDMAKNSKWKTMIDFKGYTLPGGTDPYPTCGTCRFSKCREHDFGKRIVHNCNRLSCPVCVKRSGQRIAKKIERRVWLYGLMIQKTTNFKRNDKPSHVIESIPANDVFWSWSKSKQQRLLKEMREIAGIRGGVSITHYWRFEPGKINPYVSIHNHLICFGWISSTAKKDIYKKFGVNVVYHKPKKGTLHKRKNVFSVSYYLLSHCAIKNHKHSVHWFGELSYRKIQNSYLKKFRDEEYLQQDEDIEKSKSCKLCGELMVPAKINKDFLNWQTFLPDPDEMDEGCMFTEGLLQEIDFLSEKMVFYGPNYDEIYHKTKSELEEERREVYPMIYKRSTASSRLDSWM